MIRLAALLAVFGFVAFGATPAAGSAQPAASTASSAAAAIAPRAATTGCTRAAPATAAGYTALFAAVSTREWGGADVAVSVKVGTSSVWLFGDTFSSGPDRKGRFVHSTAIVQDKGCVHVSRGGAQLLPDEHVVAVPTKAHPTLIYWIEGGVATGPSSLAVSARAISIFGKGMWDFADGGFSRTADVAVGATGDLSFRRWGAKRVSPPPDPGQFLSCTPRVVHQLCYARHTHPELKLTGGRILVTTCQNWDDHVLHTFADYRPLFSASASPSASPAAGQHLAG